MNKPTPKFEMWERVGHDNRILEVCGINLVIGYNLLLWRYSLIKPDCVTEYAEKKQNVCEDAVLKYGALMESWKHQAEERVLAAQTDLQRASDELARLKGGGS